MSKIQVNEIVNHFDNGAPTLTQGVNVVGSGISIGIGASIYSPSNNTLVLGTNTAERMSLQSDGNLSITNGDIIFAGGKGIDFSAASAGSGTTTSEIFDDYEEGYFAPNVTMDSSGTVTLKAAYSDLSYIKIGKLVTIVGQIRIDSVSSPVGNIVITNLPFTVRSTTDLGRGGSAMYYYDASAGSGNYTKNFPIKTNENTTSFEVLIKDTNGGLTPNDNDELSFSFSYVAA